MKKNINIHIDDAGLSESTNQAILDLYNQGLEFSTSVMPVTPGFYDYRDSYKNSLMKQIDTGVHITLTSEWENMKTKPISEPNEVETLLDKNGNLHSSLTDIFTTVDAHHLKKEIHNQIMYVLDHGIEISHIDSHMGVLLNQVFFKHYIEAAEKFSIVPFVKYPSNPYEKEPGFGDWFGGCGNEIDEYLEKGYTIFDGMDPHSLGREEDYVKGLNYFSDNMGKRLDSLPEGNNYFIFHVINENGEEHILDRDKRYIEQQFLKHRMNDTLEKKGIGTFKIKNIKR